MARRLLVISERLPRPDESAGSQRLLAILTLLARHHEIDLWVERDECRGRHRWSPTKVADDRARLAAAGIDVTVCGWRALSQRLAGAPYDAVLFEFHQMAARYARFVRDRQPSARMIVDSVDVHFARLEGSAALGLTPAREVERAKRAELAAYRAADAVIVASNEDRDLLSHDPHMPPLFCVPPVAQTRRRALGPREPVALFVGHFHHAPNVDGLGWFVNDVWPLVRAHREDARLDVIGSRMPDHVRAFESKAGIRTLGYVPDITPHLDRVALAIAPLRYGAGMKGKVAEAMASGLPVVTTSIGAQGLDLVDGEHAFLAADAEAFAAAVVRLMNDQDLGARVGLSGQRLIGERCSSEGADAVLRTLVDDTVRRPHAGSPPASTLAAVLGERLRRWRLASEHIVRTAARRQAHWLEPDSRP